MLETASSSNIEACQGVMVERGFCGGVEEHSKDVISVAVGEI